jgi:hypothetical protein
VRDNTEVPIKTIQLSADEAIVLREVLQSYHDSLLLEISHSDTREFKDMLRARETVVSHTLEQLNSR